MTQEFKKPVGQAVQAENADIQDQSRTIHIHGNTVAGDFAAGDIHNHHVFNAVGNEDLDEERRQQLSRRAVALEAKYGVEKWKTRRMVNDIVGVTSQDVMQARHFQPASKVYDLLFQIEELKQQVQETARSRDAANDPGTEAAVLRLQQQLSDSAAAMAKLTERNARLGADLKQASDARIRVEAQYAKMAPQLEQANGARARAEAQYTKAVQQIEMLRAQSQTLERVRAERDRLGGAVNDLQQQTGQLEAHLQRASLRLVATRRKVAIVSFALAAAALACIYLTHRLLSAGAATGASTQKAAAVAPVSEAHERHAAAASTHGIRWARHRVVVHRAEPQDLPQDPGQSQPPVIGTPSAPDDQVTGYVQRSDGS